MTCCVEGCESPVRTMRMCSKHYQRVWRHGGTKAKAWKDNLPAPRMGERSNKAKITDDQARLIIERVDEGRPVRDIAWIYGLTLSTVYKLIRGDSWRHI